MFTLCIHWFHDLMIQWYIDVYIYIHCTIMSELFWRQLAILQNQSSSLPGRLDDSSFRVWKHTDASHLWGASLGDLGQAGGNGLKWVEMVGNGSSPNLWFGISLISRTLQETCPSQKWILWCRVADQCHLSPKQWGLTWSGGSRFLTMVAR